MPRSPAPLPLSPVLLLTRLLPLTLALATIGCGGQRNRLIFGDVLVAADLFAAEPVILSAGYGFEGIIGVAGDEAEVRAAGGTWNSATCTNGGAPPRRVLTSAVDTSPLLGGEALDAMPIVFSWPILPSTLTPGDFAVHLNDGSTVTPTVATLQPNYEYNERQVAVVFGEFGNRLRPGEDGAIYPVRVEIVADDTPLMLVGPKGPVRAVGLSHESSNPYVAGPSLVAAKLNVVSGAGEGGPTLLGGPFPNDAAALYGAKAKYRLRTYTTGGFSPDGVRGLRPDEFERFFRLQARGADGGTVLVERVGQDYAVEGGTLRVIGLADLGQVAGGAVVYDDCYLEDWDNYIDIVLDGDEAAMRSVVAVEIPAVAPYGAFYNPGGPGNRPSDDVRYTAPGPAQVQPVTIALDDPMVVDYRE